MPRLRALVISSVVLLIAVGGHASASDEEALMGYVEVSRANLLRYSVLPSETLGDSLAEAYSFQRRLAKREWQRLGPEVGYKVGYASVAAQQQFGVDQPARGRLFLLQQVASGGTIGADEFVEIMLETEVAFTLSRTISGPIDSVDELKSCVRWVHPALDASDYRFDGRLKPTPVDMIATGLGAHRFVLGPGVPPDAVDLAGVELALSRNGEEIRRSPASEVLGSPWNSLLWLVNSVAKDKRARALPAGAVIVSGTADKAYKVTGDAIRGEYIGDCGPLGQVRLTIE